MAATRDLDLIREFGAIMAREWTAIGLRGMYGYMADLATEPRWYRVHETFTEDPELASEIMSALVPAIQGRELGPQGVALTIKHFPGGPAEGGGDPHYTFGKNQVYPAGRFDDHVRPFKAAIAAGTDVLSGFNDHTRIAGLVNSGRLSEARLDESVRRLLAEQFRLGLFENPYVDPAAADGIVGNAEFRARAELAQRKPVVLLRNAAVPGSGARLPPLPATRADGAPLRLYTMGLDAATVRRSGFAVTAGDYDAAAGETRPAIPQGTDCAVIRVTVSNPVLPVAGENPPQTIFGGALPDELDFLSFSRMATARSWRISPTLADIQAVMNAVGPQRTVLAIHFRQPYVLDDASGLNTAGALLAIHGVGDAALMDVITGGFNPQGRLPVALASSVAAVVRQAPDAPGYPPEDTLHPFGFGLSY